MPIAAVEQNLYFKIQKKNQMTSWDLFYLDLAQSYSRKSKDPSTKVGAVISDQLNRFVSAGLNGFPRGIADTEERLNNRELKYPLILHAEHNAILFARRDLADHTLYTWPFPPCHLCSLPVIQVQIRKVIAPLPTPEQEERWGDSFDKAIRNFKEAKVFTILVNVED